MTLSTGPPLHRLLIFVPEGPRLPGQVPLDLFDRWVVRILEKCAELFGGATAYGRGVGIWTDRERRKHWDRITVIESMIDLGLCDLKRRLERLWVLLRRMKGELRRIDIGCMLDNRWRTFAREKTP